jgi:hypothetical protein
VALGLPQTLLASVDATTLEGTQQTIALGPVASQIAIKQLGTNGGGFFNVNAAHPFENPTALTNFVQIWQMLVVSVALVFAFGRLVGDSRQARALLWVMGILLVAGVAITYAAEVAGTPMLHAAGVDPADGNMEGKEVRFGLAMSALWGHRCSNLKRQNEPRRSDHSGCKTEELIDETNFACRLTFSLDAVTAADHPHGFEAHQGHGGGFHRLETTRRPDHALERPMIRFKDVIQIFRGAVFDIPWQQPFVLQASDGLRIGCQFVGRDRGRRIVAHHPQSFA